METNNVGKNNKSALNSADESLNNPLFTNNSHITDTDTEDDAYDDLIIKNVFNQFDSKYFTYNDIINNIIKQHHVKSFQEHLSLICLNARSLFYKMNQLDVLVKQFNYFFNIIVITETWLNEQSANLIYLPNYHFVFKNRRDRQGGGVGIFVKQGLEYTVSVDSVFDSDIIDMLCLNLKSRHFSKNIKVIAVYRPPNTEFDNFSDKIGVIINHIKPTQETYIVGDFNVNLLESSIQTTSFKNLMYTHCFLPLITAPTRITTTTSSLIDNIFTNNPHQHHNGIIVSDFSDHYFIYTISSVDDTLHTHNSTKLKRKLTQTSFEKIRLALAEVDWSIVTSEGNIDKACSNLYSIIDFNLNHYAPLKIHRPKNKKTWVTKEIIKLSNKKNYLFKKYITNPTTKNKKKYTTLRNNLTTLKRNTENNFIEQNFLEAKNDIKRKWEIINNLINKKPNSTNINKIFHNNSYIEDKQEICNILNNYYVNITKTLLSDQISTETNNILKLNLNFTNSMYVEETNISEILLIVKNMKNKKSVSDDNLSTFILKNIISEILSPLNYIFNLSFSQGIFPASFKTSKIVPIFKKGNKEDITNYRPISLLSPLAKVLEKLMTVRLKAFFQRNNALTDKQYGFRSHHSTELALLEFAQNVLNNMNNKILTIGLFIDLSKAFDVINHELLLLKLNSYGVRGNAFSWIKSYLSDRFQYVSLANYNSDKIKIL